MRFTTFAFFVCLTLAGNVAYANPPSELISRVDLCEPTERFPSCHGSTIAICENGDLLAAWYAGEAEKNPDVAILAARKKKGENEWSEPWVLHDTKDYSDGNPVLWTDPGGKLWLFFVAIIGTDSWNNCPIFCKTSSDNGETWSEVRTLRERKGWMTRNHPIVLKSGRWLLPLYNEVIWQSQFMYSDDEGNTWSETGNVVFSGFNGNIQPTVIQRESGELFALARSANIGVHWSFTSTDDGMRWSSPQRHETLNPNAASEMVMTEEGHVVLVNNDSSNDRNPLTAYLSVDEGKTWTSKRNIEATPGGSFAYPSIWYDSAAKSFHVTFTNNRLRITYVNFTEAWVKGEETSAAPADGSEDF
ncbi:MAG: exo-alpha-sialidase [Planctomycetes bacterium]|nr:exo-alpha-sialidase [Planctomycetota bacterium]